ncbi:MAG: hypothetical protein R3A12_11895 [Ignavibacteria bacterium]
MPHSNGDIYEFSEGVDGEVVNYKLYKLTSQKRMMWKECVLIRKQIHY